MTSSAGPRTPHDLMRLNADLLFRRDESGRLTTINEPWGGGPAPLVYLGRSPSGTVVRFRADAPQELVEAVTAFADTLRPTAHLAESPDGSAEQLARLVDRLKSVTSVHSGPAFRFPSPLFAGGAIQIYPGTATLLHPSLATWTPDLKHARPAFVTVIDRQGVAICASVRLTPEAAAAGVETAPGYRGRGAAGLATVAWAVAVRESGKVPFYSTAWSNAASLAVARKLELVFVGEDIHVS